MQLILWWLRWCVAPLCFGGGGSSSSSASTSNTTTTTNNTDKRLVVDGNSVGVSADGSTVNVSSTDHDAVKRSFDLATVSSTNQFNTINEAVRFAGDALRIASDGTKSALKVASDSANTATASVAGAYQTAQDSASGMRLLIAAGAVIGLVIVATKYKKAA